MLPKLLEAGWTEYRRGAYRNKGYLYIQALAAVFSSRYIQVYTIKDRWYSSKFQPVCELYQYCRILRPQRVTRIIRI